MFTPTIATNSQGHWFVMMVKHRIPSCRRLCDCWTHSTTRHQLNKQLVKESTATRQCPCHYFPVSHDLASGPLAQDKYDSKALRGLWKEIEKPSKPAFRWCDCSSSILPSAQRPVAVRCCHPRQKRTEVTTLAVAGGRARETDDE